LLHGASLSLCLFLSLCPSLSCLPHCLSCLSVALSLCYPVSLFLCLVYPQSLNVRGPLSLCLVSLSRLPPVAQCQGCAGGGECLFCHGIAENRRRREQQAFTQPEHTSAPVVTTSTPEGVWDGLNIASNLRTREVRARARSTRLVTTSRETETCCFRTQLPQCAFRLALSSTSRRGCRHPTALAPWPAWPPWVLPPAPAAGSWTRIRPTQRGLWSQPAQRAAPPQQPSAVFSTPVNW